MKKITIALILFAFVSAFAANIPECWMNHVPPSEWPDTYAKGVAGRTILFAIASAPGPNYFGWAPNEEDFIAMMAIIDDYETWYADRMAEVASIMVDLDTEILTPAELTAKLDTLYEKLRAIDDRFFADAHACWALVPGDVQDNFINFMGG